MTGARRSANADRGGIGLRDLADEAVASVLARPARSALTILGTVLGICALVATLGISTTAGQQIVGRLDELQATQVAAEPAGSFGPGQPAVSELPWDIEDRLLRLNGVESAGAYADVDVDDRLVTSFLVERLARDSRLRLRVVAATPGLFEAVRGTIGSGRAWDAGFSQREDRVAVLGRAAADRLGITEVAHAPAIFIGDEPFTVIGILEQLPREGDLLSAVLIPEGTARALFDLGAPSRVIVDTALGAAPTIAAQVPLALVPNDPEQVRVTLAQAPVGVRAGIEADVQALFVTLGLVALLVGGVGIANTTLVSVLERVGEIGLRRALGAGRAVIALHFLAESTLLGLVGGILGSSTGVVIVVAFSAWRGWVPVLDPWLAPAAAMGGAAMGLVAGLYPALRAASLEAAEALRAG